MPSTTATERRAAWCNEVIEIATTHKMPTLAVMVIRSEWRSLGRSKGWKWAGEWFELALADIVTDGKVEFAGMQWLTIQSLIWFSREA